MDGFPAATGYTLKTEYRWEIARLAGDATLLRSGSTSRLADRVGELQDALRDVYDLAGRGTHRRGRDEHPGASPLT
jgi:hypothetical protein